MSKVIYTSPVFKDENGNGRKFLIAAEGVSTHAKRDAMLLKMIALGGIHAKPTEEFMGYRKKMLAAKRKIEKNGWFSSEVV